MDPVCLTIIVRGIGMIVAIVGGILVARYGFILYRDGIGAGRDGMAFEAGKVKIKARSIGSVIMVTAFMWVWAGVLLGPNLKNKVEGSGSNIFFKTPLKQEYSNLQGNPDQIKAAFQEAVAEAGNKALFEVNGLPARIDPDNVDIIRLGSGEYEIMAKTVGLGESATLLFTPKIESGEVVFTQEKKKGE